MRGLIKILILIIVLGITGYVIYDQIEKWHKRKLDTALERERTEWKGKTGRLEEKITNLQEELTQQREALVPRERLFEVFGEETTVVSPEQRVISCEELERHIISFFAYLDKKEYRKSYKLEEDTYALFQQIFKQLSEKPPTVTGEMKDLSSLIRNMAHFYRVLGRKRVEFIREIVRNESEIIESLMLIFYTWSTSGNRCEEVVKWYPSLEVVYEYAGFFLNTLAGKSYLLRRDSRVRILASYYCILILDRADEASLNRHGIDIRPYIDFLFYDISNQRGLVYRKQYLTKLVGLKEKYRR